VKKSLWSAGEIPRARLLYFWPRAQSMSICSSEVLTSLTQCRSISFVALNKRLTSALLIHTEVVSLRGVGHLEGVTWRNTKSGKAGEKKIAHVFVMTGASPNTG
jgi:thioredoxin reductase